MAITEDEAAALIAKLNSHLSNLPDSDRQEAAKIVNDWRQDVATGKAIDRKLRVRESAGLDPLGGVEQTRRVGSGEFIGREEFTKLEQLDMLIQALALGRIAPIKMAERFLITVSQFAAPDIKTTLQIKLVRPATEDDSTVELDRDAIDKASTHADKLAKALQTISDKIELQAREILINERQG